MEIERKKVKGEDFINKLLAGERDFYGIELEYSFDLSAHELFPKLNAYLRNEYLSHNPVVINNSDLSGIRGTGLYLPYLKAESCIVWNANFEHCTLNFTSFRSTDFTYTVFRHTDLDHSDLQNANLQYAHFDHSNLYFADLRNANLEFARLEGTDLVLADLRGAKNLGKTQNLRAAALAETRTTRKEEEIVRYLLEEGNPLEVEG
jgi:uncharacterized protein YjbI with pentapeptide repeats